MNIGIVEYNYHVPSLAMFLELFDNTEYEIVLFTTSELYFELEKWFGAGRVPIKHLVLKNNDKNGIFLRRIISASNTLNLLIMPELQFPDFEEWSVFLRGNWACPVWCVLHDIVKETGREAAFFWRRRKYMGRRFYKESLELIDRIIVHHPLMKSTLEGMVPGKPVTFLPFSLFDPSLTKSLPDDKPLRVRLCVPGTITDMRRDYMSLLKAFGEALDHTPNLQLVLAGRAKGAYGQTVIEECQRLRAEKNASILYYEEYISETNYREIMMKTDFLIAPLTAPSSLWSKAFRPGGYKCQYNIGSKQTGATFDAIRFQIPVAYPSFFADPEDTHEGSVLFQDFGELKDLMISLAMQPRFLRQITKAIMNFAASYRKETFQASFLEDIKLRVGMRNCHM